MLRPALYLVFLTVFAASLAQAQAGHGTLQGVVIDMESGDPVAGALVELMDGQNRPISRALADSVGRFTFRNIRSGPFILRAGRIGYRSATTPRWRVAANELLDLEIRLDLESIPLAPLTVVAARRTVGPSPMLEGYRARLNSGLGSFITREDIEASASTLVTDLIGTIPGVQLVSSGSGLHRTVYMNRARPGRDCPAQIYVDGFLLNRRLLSGDDPGFRIDDAVSLGSVEGIEIYRGLAGVPAEFMGPDAPCGVVAIWTRRGDRERS
jgi:hypothetical protein